MADRRSDRDRRRDPQNEWNWDYYYEYRYMPDDYGPSNYDPEYDPYWGSAYGTPYYGRYSGYGPRDYRRSDDRILEDINDRLTWHSLIDATDINVAVSNGVVTLTGSVDSRPDKRLAEDIADDVPGVWDVDNRLTVRNRGYYRGWRGNADRGDIREGMEVVDRDEQRIGQVKEVRSNDFLMDRSMARDVYVPFSACRVYDDRIHLQLRADEVDTQGWSMPEPVDNPRSQKKRP